MNTRTTATLAAAAILLLAGCTPQPTRQAEPDPESLYLQFLRSEHRSLDGVPDESILAVGHNTCAAWEDGATWDDIAITALVNAGDIPIETVGAMIGAGTKAFCPEYFDQIG